VVCEESPSIQLPIADVFFHSAWHEVTNAHSIRNGPAQFATRNLNQRTSHETESDSSSLNAKSARKSFGCPKHDAWARDHDEASLIDHLSRFEPTGKIRDAIGAHQQKEIVLWMEAMELGESLGRIARRRKVLLDPFDAKSGMACCSQFNHLTALFESGQSLTAFVRWMSGGHEPDLIEFCLIPALFRQNQVTHVNGVKRAAKYADSHDRKSSFNSTEIYDRTAFAISVLSSS
jgi:hypothetical protein